MQILAFFTNNGSPATGLSPTIRIREIPAGTLVVTDAAMSEIGDGHYSYEFTGYLTSKDYAIRCDGGATLTGSERYTYAGNENYLDDIDWTIDRNTTLLGVSGDVVAVSAAVKENYNLIQNVNTNVLGVSADVLVVDGKIDSIQLDVDSIQLDVLRNYTQILSLSASNQENFNEVNTNILGVSASLEDITVSAAGANEVADAVWSKTLSSGQTAEQILINNSNDLKRLLGLTHENIYIDQPVYDGDNNLTSARVRIYDSAANVGTASGVIGTYQITSPGDGPGKFTSWRQIRT